VGRLSPGHLVEDADLDRGDATIAAVRPLVENDVR
jgi:hypothetical protein